MLNIHNLSVSFQGDYLFEKITFQLGAGTRVGLVGKNGAGKSTLLKIISVSYQHLTLPTIYSVSISVVAVPLQNTQPAVH